MPASQVKENKGRWKERKKVEMMNIGNGNGTIQSIPNSSKYLMD